jgi:hypothetical protein
MKHLSLRRALALALCACLTVTLLTAFSPTRSAHAATAHAASCSNLNMGRGTIFSPGLVTTNYTCRGALLVLTYQDDGNFVLYIGGKAKWATNTSSTLFTPVDVQFQSDGNLVVYSHNLFGTRAIWASNTAGKGATRLSLQDDGNLVMYTASGKALWATHTSGY